MSEEKFIQFLLAHEGDDPARLLLSADRWPGIDVRRAARLIEGRRKLREKVPSWHAFPEIDYPDGIALEQCSSEEAARYKQAFVPEGGRIADLTGGLGVDCWMMSRRAATAHYCERDAGRSAAARHNFTVLDAGNITVHEGDGIAWLQNQTERFDLVYLDPARRDKTAGRVYDIAACEPNLLEIKDLLLKKAGRVLAKISPMADISRTLEQLPETREVHVVAVGGEVKELLLLLEPSQSGQPLPEPQIIAADGALRFAFAPAEEAAATVRYADRIGRYLYQPSKALRKAGAFRLLSQRFGLAKLAPATQLYTSDGIVEGFPGKRFEVEAVLDWGRAAIEELKRRYDRLEMTALNFPLDTEALRRRIGIPGGGDRHIFATTLSDKRKILLICKI